jgi:hypothetical protein
VHGFEPNKAREWLGANWWLVCITAAALAVRLHWNLSAHPIGEFVYSDMHGYDGLSNQILDDPWGKDEFSAFFPYGTPFLLAAIKFVFGRGNFTAIGIVYALMGAGTVACTYQISRRISPGRWVAPLVGLVAVVYYPLISISGYLLSEGPAAFFMVLSTLLLLRLVDHGKARDAWTLGVIVAVGASIRPQILLSGALFFVYWLVTRRRFPRVTPRRLVQVALPIVVGLGFSAVRMHHHSQRLGLISENGRINQVLGRCHISGISAMPDGKGHREAHFVASPLRQLEKWQDKHPDSWMRLDPVFGTDPRRMDLPGFEIDGDGCEEQRCIVDGAKIQYAGYIGDRDIQREIVRECVRRSGLLTQLRFSLTNVALLWGYNSTWPDRGNPKPRALDEAWHWRVMSDRWKDWHNLYLMPAALLGLAFPLFPNRYPRQAVVAIGVWGLIAVTVAYIGGIRFRIPYDSLILVLAAQAYAVLVGFGVAWLRSRRPKP